MKTLHLLLDILEENQLPPEKLHRALESCLLQVNQYLTSPDISKHETEIIIGKELEDVLRPFVNLLDFSTSLKENNK